MRVSISNIAWETADDEAVVALLRERRVDAIDVAPGKYFAQPAETTPDEVRRVRDWWSERGVEVIGVQALLFGTSGLNLFGTPETQQRMLKHLGAVCRIAAGLGATRLVFGSPRNRDPRGLAVEASGQVAVAFFQRLGDVAAAAGVTVCLEPNPPRYDCSFMTTTPETVAVVRAVAHPSIRLQIDTGALTINGEDPDTTIAACADLVGHVHASEPDLVPLGDGGTDHKRMSSALRRAGLHMPVTIEMLPARTRPPLEAIATALTLAESTYGGNRG